MFFDVACCGMLWFSKEVKTWSCSNAPVKPCFSTLFLEALGICACIYLVARVAFHDHGISWRLHRMQPFHQATLGPSSQQPQFLHAIHFLPLLPLCFSWELCFTCFNIDGSMRKFTSSMHEF